LSASPASDPSTTAASKLLGDKAYDSAELRQWLKDRGTGRSQQLELQSALQLRQEILQTTTPHRERLLPAQGFPTRLHPIRQTCSKLPRLRLPRRCYRMVDLMSLSPSYALNEETIQHLVEIETCMLGALP
jgi:hypothetical protein